METWALWQFALAFVAAISGFALIISDLHIIEKAEEQELWRKAKAKIASLK